MKRFVNSYGLYRTMRTIEGNSVDFDTLALWTVVRVRWPRIADHLERKPEAVNGILQTGWAAAFFPADLRDVVTSRDVRTVVTHPQGGPLSPEAIRGCCGLGETAPA